MKEFSIITLANGIRCVHRESHSSVAYLSMTINAGTRDELQREHGVAHLTEHMIFRGTQKRSAYQISQRLEARGGDLNAFTTKEETVLHTTSLVIDYNKALELIVDIAFRSKFLPKDIDAEREIIIDEINSYKDSPSDLIFDDFEGYLFKDEQLGRSILGSKQQLKKIHRDNVIDYTARCFTTDEIVITSSSSLSHSKFALICDKYLSSIPKTTRQNSRTISLNDKYFNLELNKRTHQVHSLLGGYAPSFHADSRISTALLLNILGGPFSTSILNQTLRERRSLTYSVEASYTPLSDTGIFNIYFSCEKQKYAQTKELLLKELHKLKTTKLSGSKFDLYKHQFLGQLTISNENLESMMLSVGKSLLVFNSFDTNNDIYDKIVSLTIEDILSAAQILDEGKLSTLTYL